MNFPFDEGSIASFLVNDRLSTLPPGKIFPQLRVISGRARVEPLPPVRRFTRQEFDKRQARAGGRQLFS